VVAADHPDIARRRVPRFVVDYEVLDRSSMPSSPSTRPRCTPTATCSATS